MIQYIGKCSKCDEGRLYITNEDATIQTVVFRSCHCYEGQQLAKEYKERLENQIEKEKK